MSPVMSWFDRELLLPLMPTLVDWKAVGKKVLSELPPNEHNSFIAWLESNDSYIDIYVKSPGDAIRLWHNSIDRYMDEGL